MGARAGERERESCVGAASPHSRATRADARAAVLAPGTVHRPPTGSPERLRRAGEMGRRAVAAAAAFGLLAAAAPRPAAAWPSRAGCNHPVTARGPHGAPVDNSAITVVLRDGNGDEVSEVAPGGAYTAVVSGDQPRALLLTEETTDLCKTVTSRKSAHEVAFTAPLEGTVSFKVRARACRT